MLLDVCGTRTLRAIRLGLEEDGDTDVVVEKRPEVARARRFCVVFYNDDYTTKWFVVHVLQRFFHMDETAANRLMMAVHRHGKGIAGVYSRDVAETKAALVVDYAREHGMPLLVTAEPEES
jgi:ATP-dependent Clp protease adaptor protein ClpS